MRAADVSLLRLDMFGCCNLYIGATLVVQETYQFGDAMNLIKKYHVNTMCGVPTMYQLFVKGAEAEDLAGFIRKIFATGMRTAGYLL